MVEVPQPDAAARDALMHALSVEGGWGRLGEVAGWLAGAQGSWPPRLPNRPMVLIVAGDHGIVEAGVSSYPQGSTLSRVAAIRAGAGEVSALAARAGARGRVLDLSVDGPVSSPTRIRRGSGRIDLEDALTAEQTQAAFDVGRGAVDAEVDAGTELLLVGDLATGSTTAAAVLVAALTGAEPVAVLRRGGRVDDATWMRKAAAVRDALRRVHSAGVQWEALGLLTVAGGADLAALTGILVQAAARRTPVLLDGMVSCACALAAELAAPGAASWWLAAQGGPDPAQRQALTRLGLRPLLELDLDRGEAVGALLALPLVLAAVDLAAGTPAPLAAGTPAAPPAPPHGPPPAPPAP